MIRVTAKTVGIRSTIRNMAGKGSRLERDVSVVVIDSGEKMFSIAQDICPVKTGKMRDELFIEFSNRYLFVEVGWDAIDFLAEGLAFYPPFQEYGTSKFPAQPTLIPAFDAVQVSFHAGCAEALRTATRRKAA